MGGRLTPSSMPVNDPGRPAPSTQRSADSSEKSLTYEKPKQILKSASAFSAAELDRPAMK